MKVCPNCSAEFEDQLNFCRHDGTPLKTKASERLCPQCGEEVEEGKKFCRHCGASLEEPNPAEPIITKEALVRAEEKPRQSIAEAKSLIEVAEDCLRDGNYQDAIAHLESFLKKNPDDQEARLLHLYASIKLYNIYGYEKQIDAIKLLSNLTEKEKEIAREIFLIRSEEAQKRGKEDEAREYQRLATRVILGQPLVEPVPEVPVKEMPVKKLEVKPVPQKAEQRVQVTPRQTPSTVEAARSYVARNPGTRKRASRLFLSFALVFGLAGVLVAGMLLYYAKKQGVEVADLFQTKAQPKKPPAGESRTPDAQVIGAEELGFRVWGTGAMDANRRVSLISEKIDSQLSSLRELYQQEVQKKRDLMGSLTLQLTISPSGTVTKVEEFASRLEDKEFKKSVVDEAYKWRFPEAGSGLVKVNYPLLFLPPGMDIATLVKWEQVVGPGERKLDEPPEGSQLPGKSKPPRGDSPLSPPRPTAMPPPKLPVPPSPTPPVVSPAPTPPPPPPMPTPQPPQPPVRIGPYEVLYPTSVYSEPREDSRRVARIEAGTKVNVVDAQGDWLEIRSKQGRPPGFIKKDSAVPMGRR